MLKTPMGRFRAVALLEGLSFVVLLFLAMPLKYMGGQPQPVKWLGWAHGMLFMLYVPALLQVAVTRHWSRARLVGAFGASLVPFGTFVLDARLRREERQGPRA
jgi:integral membrane protein